MPTGDPYCSVCKSFIPCLHIRFGYHEAPEVWLSDERNDIFIQEEKEMDITGAEGLLISQRLEEVKLTRAQEMAQLADASRRKSAATYRYSLLMYVREVIEREASKGHNSFEIYSRSIPWTVDELQAVLPFLENDGFKVSLEIEMEKDYNGIGGGTGILGNYTLKPTNNKILKISW